MNNKKNFLNNKKKLLLTIVILLAIILLAGGCYFLFVRDNKAKLINENISTFIYDISIDYKKINTDEIINEYHLQQIEKEIKNNENYFKKYSFVAINNDKISSIRQEIFDIFGVIVDNIEYIDKEYILYALSELNIEYVDELEGSGQYAEVSNTILIKTDESFGRFYQYTIYHELMHFIDSSFESHKSENKIYFVDDKFYLLDEINKLGLSIDDINVYERDDIDFNFIIEGCAEYYTYKYLTGFESAYPTYTSYIKILEFVLGEKEMRRIFFSSDSAALLIKDLLDKNLGESFDEIYNAFNSSDYIEHVWSESTEKDKVAGIVNLCKLLKINWYDYEGIGFFISEYVIIHNEEYKEYYDKYYDNRVEKTSKLSDMINEKIEYEKKVDFISSSWDIDMNDIYYLVVVKDQNDIIKCYKVEVDFDNEKIISINESTGYLKVKLRYY